MARTRLASGDDLTLLERGDLEVAARGCDGEQPDPWDRVIKWDGCPAKSAMARADIQAAIALRGLASMSALHDWPGAYAGCPVETWMTIEVARGDLAAARAS